MFNFLDLNFEKIKLLVIVLLIQCVSFVIGMYTGRTFWTRSTPLGSNITNYSTNPTQQTTTQKDTSPETTTEDCTIKGNISGTGKIYHLPDGAFYERTTAEMCFDSEQEAQAAGFTKSSR